VGPEVGFTNGSLYVEPARDRVRVGAAVESSCVLSDVAAAMLCKLGEAGTGMCDGVIGGGMEARLGSLDRGGGLGATCGGIAIGCAPYSSRALPRR
jgi:hypothetical protein